MQMPIRMAANWTVDCRHAIAVVASLAWFSLNGSQAMAQRVLGADISYWNCGTSSTGLSQQNWTDAYNGGRQFVMIRATRGGTTGLSQTEGTPGGGSLETLSLRYDDSRFMQNITRATTAGMLAGAYHFGRPDNPGNTGTDEADHFVQMAGAFMRPGYLMPTYDMEAGSGADTLAQFTIDFSNELYSKMQIRPSIYINGNYSSILQGATQARRDLLAKPATSTPSPAGPAYPMVWDARYYPTGTDPNTIPIQTGNPKDNPSTLSTMYGPWDDYGNSSPWSIWQYSSIVSMPGFNDVDATDDGDVAHGDIEYLRDFLVPAVLWHDTNGNYHDGQWSDLSMWNSGQTPVAPVPGAGQATPYPGGSLPTARLPGAAGTGPTSGQYDTVIMDAGGQNVTVTLSTGSYNIRKLYMRETLNITGGSLTINYDPLYNFNIGVTDSLRSGPISAQFSGAVTMSGNAALTVPVLQIDASRTFTLAGGTLTFNKINLLSSAKILVSGDVALNPWSTSNPRYTSLTASINGASGNVDLNGGTRIFTIGDVAADVDLDVAVPIINGGLTKNGAGTMRLSGSNTFAGPVTVNAGVLRSNNGAGFSSSSTITVNGGALEMNNVTDTVASLAGSGGAVTQGGAGLTLAATSGSTTFAGTITGTGTLTKNGDSTQILSGNNSLGPVALSAGSLLFNGSNTTGAITVDGGTLGGTGSVSGAVTVNSTGHLAPGASIGPIGLGALTLNAGSVLDIELGAPGTSDLMNISGALTLNGGSVNLVDMGGLDVGTYTLALYSSKVGSVANLGAPIGPSNFNYKLTASGNFLSLFVSLPGDFDLDGTVDGNDYAVWRKTDGTQADYDLWRANYGRAVGSGSGAGLGGSANVPEPAAILLAVCGALSFMNRRIRRER
jgi:autotransporter-associated beta strand protein